MSRSCLGLLLPFLLFVGCAKPPSDKPSEGVAPGVSASSSSSASSSMAAEAPPAPHLPPPVREGGALMAATGGKALWLADEDHGVLRRFLLPLGEAMQEFPLPGRPAQVLALDGRILVSIRDPGLLLVFKEEAPGQLVEEARIAVAADAWGLAISQDEKLVIVTSAWTHTVTLIDLTTKSVKATLDVAREPRGVVIAPKGDRAYVTHLVGERVTRIDDLWGTPAVSMFDGAPPDPNRPKPKTPGKALRGAGLGYTALLSPDGTRLFLPHHQVLGFGPLRWFGEPTVDVIATKDDKPLLPPHSPGSYWRSPDSEGISILGDDLPTFVAPRAAVYRQRTRTLLVASEATDTLVELDTLSLLPAERAVSVYQLGRHYEYQVTAAKEGGAPTGIALSVDGDTAYVFCRSTYDIVSVPLGPGIPREPAPSGPVYTRIAKDPISEDISYGRRLFYSAMDSALSDGVSCATCHPEGRDDGFVWNESGNETFLSFPRVMGFMQDVKLRQTAMLAGRVDAEGPYGWLAESPNLKSRVIAGFSLHRWVSEETQHLRSKTIKMDPMLPSEPQRRHSGEYLADYLRKGLVPPPRPPAASSELLARGKALFEDPKVGCAGCHDPKRGYTNRVAVPLAPARNAPPSIEPEGTPFRTPSLLFVGGTPPYFHDGSVDTLEDLIEQNGERMGKTGHLSKADKDALVAFLRTL